MTIGVLWEFFEFGMDFFLGTDMQKDTVIHAIHSVSLDPTLSNKVVTIPDIQDVVINGESLGLGGYLDIGIIDTMKDLFVNFIGAVVFSLSGFFFARSKGRRKSAAQGFVPSKKTAEQDYLQQALEEADQKDADAPTPDGPRRRENRRVPERPTQTENHRPKPVVFRSSGRQMPAAAF